MLGLPVFGSESDTISVRALLWDTEVVLECCFVFGQGSEEGELGVYWLITRCEEARALVRWCLEVSKSDR